jgi:hypothetical protein
MSETQEWLEEHRQHLGEIARKSDMSPELVDLAAVLVLAELSDAQVYDRLLSLVRSLGAGRRPVLGLPHVITEIRDLAMAHTTEEPVSSASVRGVKGDNFDPPTHRRAESYGEVEESRYIDSHTT